MLLKLLVLAAFCMSALFVLFCYAIYKDPLQGYLIGKLYVKQFRRMEELLDKLTHVVLLRVDVNSIHALVTGEPISLLVRRKWLFLDIERRGDKVTSIRHIFQTDDDPTLNELRLESPPGYFDLLKMNQRMGVVRGENPKRMVLAVLPRIMQRPLNDNMHNVEMRQYNYSDHREPHVDAIYDNVRKRLVLQWRRR